MLAVGGLVLYALTGGGLASASEPKNAALLYYQALVLRPEPDDYRMIEDVLHDAEPSDELREYLKAPSCRETLRLAEAGTQIPDCDWGCRRAEGAGLSTSAMGELIRLGKLLCADARTLSHDGEYRAALERCLTVRRFAAHLGDDSSMLYGMAYGVDAMALRSVQNILGSMPPDVETLVWLQQQLKTVHGTPWELAVAIRRSHMAQVDTTLRMGSEGRGGWKEEFVEGITDPSVREEIRSMTEQEILAEARESYAKIIESAISVIASEAPIESRHEALAPLRRELAEESKNGGPVSLLEHHWSAMSKWLNFLSGHALWYNSTVVAVDVYLTRARTGQLPAALTKDLPKAPYNGRDFEYERTRDGFVLRYLKKEHAGREKVREIAFKVVE